MKPRGIYKNGDLYYGGHPEIEDGKEFFPAWNADNINPEAGPDYQTEEMPETFPLFVMTIFPNGTPESEATEYFLAKRIGDARFGSECQHARAKRGYCPDCLRKVR